MPSCSPANAGLLYPLSWMSEDALSERSSDEIEAMVADVRSRMRPVEQQLSELRAERDVLLTEQRRRQRQAQREGRAGVREAVRSGDYLTLAQLVATTDEGSLNDYRYHLKTGGEVRLGFPGAREQTLAFTDGRRTAQARDLAQAASLYGEGWELGS